MSQLDSILDELADDFSEGVSYSEKHVKLRSGEESHHYVDLRVALKQGNRLVRTGIAVITLSDKMGLSFDVVAGMGVGGSAMKSGVQVAGLEVFSRNIMGMEGSTADADDRYPYGLHGTQPPDAEAGILLVDDVFTSGSSLFELADMINERGGEGKIAGAIIACARSNMHDYAAEMRDHGIPAYGALTHFYEGMPPVLVAA